MSTEHYGSFIYGHPVSSDLLLKKSKASNCSHVVTTVANFSNKHVSFEAELPRRYCNNCGREVGLRRTLDWPEWFVHGTNTDYYNANVIERTEPILFATKSYLQLDVEHGNENDYFIFGLRVGAKDKDIGGRHAGAYVIVPEGELSDVQKDNAEIAIKRFFKEKGLKFESKKLRLYFNIWASY
jgi:hypothetical protein